MNLFPVKRFTLEIQSNRENISGLLTRSITRKTYRLLRRYETPFYGDSEMPGAKFRPSQSQGMAVIIANFIPEAEHQGECLEFVVRPTYLAYSLLLSLTAITIFGLIHLSFFENEIHNFGWGVILPIGFIIQLWWSLRIDHQAACISVESFIIKAQQQDLSHAPPTRQSSSA